MLFTTTATHYHPPPSTTITTTSTSQRQQDGTTSTRVKPQLQHFRHHNTTTRDYHQVAPTHITTPMEVGFFFFYKGSQPTPGTMNLRGLEVRL
jgi:hypothetical protein